MGSAAVADLVERSGHEVVVGDLRPDAAARAAGAARRNAEEVVAVDVDDAGSLASALDGVDAVLNATYMRHNVQVTDAAIAAGAHLVDLGSYWPETLQQLDRHAPPSAPAAGSCRAAASPPGSPTSSRGWAPTSWTRSTRCACYSYITHPMWTSAGIVVTRFDASTGISVVQDDGRLAERPSFGDRSGSSFPSLTANSRCTSSRIPSR